jgi:hypothetical protein
LELNYRSLLVAVVRSAPVRQRGVVEFAARRVKKIGADVISAQRSGRLYVLTYSSGSAFTSRDYTGTFSGTAIGAGVYHL